MLSSSVSAENPIITRPTDIWFEYTEPTQFVAQTYQSEGYPSDPQLWLYTDTGELIVSNDDYNGLQSYLSVELQPGRYRLRAGTCCWQPDVWRDGTTWNVQYELGYGQGAVATTLVSLPTTTLPQATTTDPPRTTTTSTFPPTTTTEQTTTTTEVSTTTTTTTLVPVVSSTSVAPSTTELQTTTSTSAPSTTTTSSSTSMPPTTTLPIPEPTLPVPIPTSTSTIPPNITEEQAAEIALNPEVLATITADEATEVFEALVIEDLTDEQLEELVASVQEAPTEVREAFEDTVDIFSGELDTYVPLGSTVPVSTRRTLVTLAAVTMAAAATTRMKW